MLRHYLTVALRQVRRHAGYASINVVGLAVGIACCLLIALYVQQEWSVDRFHANADRLYRLNKVVTPRTGGTERHVITSGPMAPALVDAYPEVEQAVRLLPWFDTVVMTHGATVLLPEDVVFADSNFFDVFSFRLQRGDPGTVLAAPLSIVLTETTAARLFAAADPVGQSVRWLNELDYTVTGIAEDPPAASHLRYDALVSFSSLEPGRGALEFGWIANWFPQALYTYLLLDGRADAGALEAKLPAFMQRNFPDRADQYILYLQAFSEIYLGSSDLLYARNLRQGSRTYVYVFSVVAVLVLLIACINFVNLATARAAKRAREVGVRKVMGAHRRQLARQFIGETLLLALLALGLAAALVEVALPAFTAFTGAALPFGVWRNPLVLIGLAAVWLVVGAGAGAYPAFVLSGFRPVRVLRGTGSGPAGGGWSRQVLVAVQFAISIALIAGTAVVYRQMDYMQTKDLGFEKAQVVVLSLDGTAMQEQYDAFKQALLQHPNVTHAAGSNSVPGSSTMGFGINPQGKAQDESWTAQAIRLDDFDLPETYGMKLAAGRYFSEQYPTDATHAVVINEALARSLGWTAEEAVGRRLDVPGEVDEGTVVGVIRDFHYASLHQAIAPLLLYYAPRHATLSLRLTGNDLPGTLASIRQTWEAFEGAYPFDYAFLDQTFARLYESEQRLMQTLGLFAVLAILVACLGLFGLAAFNAERRTKEIGIRKVLGASVPGLVAMLSKDFARLVLIAFVVAAPVAYLVMTRWLDAFAYRVDLGPGVFLAAGAVALAIAFLTVGYQALRAALADPVKSLRYE